MKTKVIENGYIVMITDGLGGTEITDEEYDVILGMIRSKPDAPEGYRYLLREDLTWELAEMPDEPEPEVDASEIAEALEGIL